MSTTNRSLGELHEWLDAALKDFRKQRNLDSARECCDRSKSGLTTYYGEWLGTRGACQEEFGAGLETLVADCFNALDDAEGQPNLDTPADEVEFHAIKDNVRFRANALVALHTGGNDAFQKALDARKAELDAVENG